jgi:hypothetical protein
MRYPSSPPTLTEVLDLGPMCRQPADALIINDARCAGPWAGAQCLAQNQNQLPWDPSCPPPTFSTRRYRQEAGQNGVVPARTQGSENRENTAATRPQQRWRRIAICLSSTRSASIFIRELVEHARTDTGTAMGTRKGAGAR